MTTLVWGLAVLIAYGIVAGCVLDDALADLPHSLGAIVSVPPWGRG